MSDKKVGKQEKSLDYKKLAEENLNGWQRAKADYQNLVKRTQEEMTNISKFANRDVIMQLLPVIDNFEHALRHTPKELEKNQWVQGVLYIKKQLLDILKNNGVEQLDCIGKDFDPKIHDAIEAIAKEENIDRGVVNYIVKEEIAKGYKMGDEVIRPAKVRVETKKIKSKDK